MDSRVQVRHEGQLEQDIQGPFKVLDMSIQVLFHHVQEPGGDFGAVTAVCGKEEGLFGRV
jgi:hypothetical protein